MFIHRLRMRIVAALSEVVLSGDCFVFRYNKRQRAALRAALSCLSFYRADNGSILLSADEKDAEIIIGLLFSEGVVLGPVV